MATLYSFGMDPTRWYSRSKWSSTSDETTWTTGSEAVQGLGALTTVARGGSQWVGATSFGEFTVSSDLINWYSYPAENKTWLVNRIAYGNGKFVAVGHEKNPTNLAETGFVAVSNNGAPGTWVRRWISYGAPVCLFDVQYMGGTNWIAVGNQDNFSNPIMLYSSDNASTWQSISLPSILTGGIYSVATSGVGTVRVWIGGKGWVANTTNWQMSNTVWNLNDRVLDAGQSRPVTRLYYRDTFEKTTVVALTGSTAWFSADSTQWTSHTQPGYRFLDCVNFYNSTTATNTLYLSTGGLMQQYTGFKTLWYPQSTQALTLTGFNNGVQASTQIVV